MSPAHAGWLLFAFLIGFLAHVLKVAFDPRSEWNRGYDAGWAERGKCRRAREGPGLMGLVEVGKGNPERN
jgi:hypothetical protein